MNVLLVNPPYTNFEGMKESGGHMMSLGLAYLASYLRKHLDCRISILDIEVRGLNYEEVKESIKKENADIIGITCLTPTIPHVFKIAEIIKKEINPKSIIVAGGIHPTALPEETIRNPFIDFVAVGEGESTFYELVKTIKEKRRDFNKINGLYFKREGKIVATPPRELIADLDEIPFPARDLFDLSLYYSAPTKKVSSDPAGPILTSRGCAFNCIHCISRKIWKGRVRFRSVQNVIKEMEECINKFGIKQFNIYDDTFTLNRERAMKICDEIIKRRWEIAWVSFSRVNTISKELAKKMKKAGCKKISFGLESGSQKVLDLMRKQATTEMGRKAVEMVVKQGILAHASFMFGNVGETEETIKETIKVAKSLPLDNATFFITSPVPGTDLYEISKKVGFITKDTKWTEFAPLTNTSPILVQRNVSKERLVYWQKRAFREFYLRPKYIFHKLKQLKSLDSFKMIFEGLRIFYRILLKG
jgi:radical SAM superfamily enzyme YgiQ (UPF0313 family)